MTRALGALLVAAALVGCAPPPEDAFSRGFVAKQHDLCQRLGSSTPDWHEADTWACVIAKQDHLLGYQVPPHDHPARPTWPTLEHSPSF